MEQRAEKAGRGRALAASTAVLAFLAGAVLAPFLGPFGALLGKPLSAFIDFVSVNPTLLSGCEWGLHSESQQAPALAGASGSPEALFSSKDLASDAIFAQQGIVEFAPRPRFTDAVIIEGWEVEVAQSDVRPLWAVVPYSDECGGEPVDEHKLILDLDQSREVLALDGQGRTVSPGGLVVTNEDPSNVVLTVSSCQETLELTLTVKYTVGALSYRMELDPVIVAAEPARRTYVTTADGALERRRVLWPCADGVVMKPAHG